jgi:hypothetical protein
MNTSAAAGSDHCCERVHNQLEVVTEEMENHPEVRAAELKLGGPFVLKLRRIASNIVSGDRRAARLPALSV